MTRTAVNAKNGRKTRLQGDFEALVRAHVPDHLVQRQVAPHIQHWLRCARRIVQVQVQLLKRCNLLRRRQTGGLLDGIRLDDAPKLEDLPHRTRSKVRQDRRGVRRLGDPCEPSSIRASRTTLRLVPNWSASFRSTSFSPWIRLPSKMAFRMHATMCSRAVLWAGGENAPPVLLPIIDDPIGGTPASLPLPARRHFF
jgi:hypothetical protein